MAYPAVAATVLVLLLIIASFNLGVVCFPDLSSSYHYQARPKCRPSGFLVGKSGHCNPEHDSECCVSGKMYPQYPCSPPVTAGQSTKAHMTINSFAEGGDGGGPSECDDRYHSDSELVVALSTGWYNHGSRCLRKIRINGNGRSVLAKVVDECDSVKGCDADHDFQPPCPNNIVDASPAVWKLLGIPKAQVGDYDVTWSDDD